MKNNLKTNAALKRRIFKKFGQINEDNFKKRSIIIEYRGRRMKISKTLNI